MGLMVKENTWLRHDVQSLGRPLPGLRSPQEKDF